MKDRFDLEQSILQVWSIVEDLKLLNKFVMENEELDADKVSNILTGLAEMYDLKLQDAFETFEELVHTGQFRKSDEKIQNYNTVNDTYRVVDIELLQEEPIYKIADEI